MSVLGFLNQKGGSGKSTLSLNVAACLAQQGARVLLVDADPQGSSADWSASRGERPSPFTVLRLDRPVLHREIANLKRGYDHVIIDGPARDAGLQRSAMLACDLVGIPVQPSGLDVWSTQAFLTLLREAQPLAPSSQKAVLLTSRIPPRSVLARGIREVLDGLGLPVVDGTTERVAYREAVTAAMTLQELAAQPAPKRVREARQAALDEIATLTHNLMTKET